MFDTDVGSYSRCACADWPRSARVSSTHARGMSPVEIPCSMFSVYRLSRMLLRMCPITANFEITSKNRNVAVKIKNNVGKCSQ